MIKRIFFIFIIFFFFNNINYEFETVKKLNNDMSSIFNVNKYINQKLGFKKEFEF